jgi:hypothetical protein
MNSLQCTDVASSVHPTSFTCVCKFGWSGSDCSLQTHPPQLPDTVTTAVIAPLASVVNPNCDLVMLDGSASVGIGVKARVNDTWGWSLAAVNSSSGASLVTDLSSVRMAQEMVFSFRPKATDALISVTARPYADYTGFGVLTFPANLLPPARYTFQLIVTGRYDSSAPARALLDTSALPAPQPNYTPNPDKYKQMPSDWSAHTAHSPAHPLHYTLVTPLLTHCPLLSLSVPLPLPLFQDAVSSPAHS